MLGIAATEGRGVDLHVDRCIFIRGEVHLASRLIHRQHLVHVPVAAGQRMAQLPVHAV
jgi:hypothetical protein